MWADRRNVILLAIKWLRMNQGWWEFLDKLIDEGKFQSRNYHEKVLQANTENYVFKRYLFNVWEYLNDSQKQAQNST